MVEIKNSINKNKKRWKKKTLVLAGVTAMHSRNKPPVWDLFNSTWMIPNNPLLFVPEVQTNVSFHHGIHSLPAVLIVAFGACMSHESAVSSINHQWRHRVDYGPAVWYWVCLWWPLSGTQNKSNNHHHNFPENKETSLNSFYCWPTIQNPKIFHL